MLRSHGHVNVEFFERVINQFVTFVFLCIDHYMEFVRSTNRLISPELDNFRHEKDNGFLYDDSDDYASNVTMRDDLAISTKADIPKLDDSQRLGTAISEIKDLLVRYGIFLLICRFLFSLIFYLIHFLRVL